MVNLNTVYLHLVLFSTIFFPVDAVISTNAIFHGYRKWAPVNSSRNDMYCPEDCFTDPEEDERCCCCSAVPCSEIDAAACDVTVGQLSVEYTDIYGSAIFVPSGNHTVYEAIHRNGVLTRFPDNLCDFADSLVKLDLSFNRIEDISGIRCLNKLDTLRLDANRIKEIDNDTFSDMEHLRIVSLSRNFIETLYPNTNQKKNGNILMVDFSYNIVESVDITNIIRPGAFCNISYEGCDVTEQTNSLNYIMTENNIHGPGDIILRNTSGTTFLNFTSLGLNDHTVLGHYFQGTLDFDGASVNCDCQLYPFFTGLGKDASKFWPRLDFGNVTCLSPENMKGRNLTQLFHSQTFEDLTCDIPDCPKNCTCTDVPTDNEVTVKCKGLTSMPDFSPIGYWNNDRINLDLSDSSNKITAFSNRGYMNRLTKLNLNGNNIQTLDANAIENLDSGMQIDIGDHNLKTLPVTFRKFHPNRINFGLNPVECNCDNVWIGDWIRNNQAQGTLQCATSKGIVPAERISAEYFGCFVAEEFPDYIIPLLVVIIVSISFISLLAYYFRYEIMLIKRKLLKKRPQMEEYQFDAMLTFSLENPEVFLWIERGIVPALKKEGYSLFVPFYDIMFGGDKEYEIAKGVGKSRNYIVFLCNKYLCDENSVQEFEIVWKHFRMDTTKNIIVINFDNFSSSEVKNRRLRAFTRIQDDLNFKDRELKLFERLKRRIGPPRKKRESRESDTDENLLDCEMDSVNDSDNQSVVDENPKDRNIPWHDRLTVRKTTCNCTYRKCYLHADDAYDVNVENDRIRKRAHATLAHHINKGGNIISRAPQDIAVPRKPDHPFLINDEDTYNNCLSPVK